MHQILYQDKLDFNQENIILLKVLKKLKRISRSDKFPKETSVCQVCVISSECLAQQP